MKLFTPRLYDQYYHTVSRFFNSQKSFKYVPIDLNKPWWNIFMEFKVPLVFEIINELIQAIFGTLTPIIIGYGITQRDLRAIIFFGIGYFILEIGNRIIIRRYDIATVSIKESFRYDALKYFLTVDPIFHSTKSSGQVISKIQGGTDDITTILASSAGSILPVLFSFIATVITLATFNGLLGIIGTVSFFAICLTNSLYNYVNSKSFSKYRIRERDSVLKITAENLTQNAFIRSSFATPEQLEKTNNTLRRFAKVTMDGMLAYGIGTTITRSLYIISTLSIAIVIFYQVSGGSLDQYLGITLIITYINGSSQILRLGRTINDFVEKVTGVMDTFEFIRNFGVQSYPVLESDTAK
jgi:ABC-type bacteriocin/lantibiotic exporter with double-glycine peptidase domain